MKKILIFIISLMLMPIGVLAENLTITEETIKSKLASWEDEFGEDISSFTDSFIFDDGVIELTGEDGNIVMEYEQNDNDFVVSYTYLVQNGISYQNYKKLTSGAIDLTIMYPLIVGCLSNLSFDDSFNYFFDKLLGYSLENAYEPVYSVIEEENEFNGEFINLTNINYIKENEFPNYAVRYAKSTPLSVLNDSDEANSFVYSTSSNDIDDNNYEITVTLLIKKNANFDKIVGYSERKSNGDTYTPSLNFSFDYSFEDDSTPTPEIKITNNSSENINKNDADTTSNTPVSYNSANRNTLQEDNPKTGVYSSFMLFLLPVIIGIGLFYYLHKKNKLFKRL